MRLPPEAPVGHTLHALQSDLADARSREELLDKQLQRLKGYLASSREAAEDTQRRAMDAEQQAGLVRMCGPSQPGNAGVPTCPRLMNAHAMISAWRC